MNVCLKSDNRFFRKISTGLILIFFLLQQVATYSEKETGWVFSFLPEKAPCKFHSKKFPEISSFSEVEQSQPLWFLLDTAANSVIDQALAKKLALKQEGAHTVLGIGGSIGGI